MAGLFRPHPNNRRPFGGIVNPFESSRPAPPTPDLPRPDPNAWRTAYGPSPFNPARRQTGIDGQPPLPEINPYADFQRRAFGTPAAAAVPAPVPVLVARAIPLGNSGAAGTATRPIWPLPFVLAAYILDTAVAALGFFIALAVRLVSMVYVSALFLFDVVLPAVPRLLAALLYVLARCAVYGFVFWWFGTVFLRVSTFFFKLGTESFLGWTWKWSPPARAYGLRREHTSWSVSPMKDAAAGPGGIASWWTDPSTTTANTDQCPLVAPVRKIPWSISFMWNATMTTVANSWITLPVHNHRVFIW